MHRGFASTTRDVDPLRVRAYYKQGDDKYKCLCLVVCVFCAWSLSDMFDVHGTLTRLLDEDACMSGLCQTDISTGMCSRVHKGPYEDVGDKSGFRLTMIDDLHDDRLSLLWEEGSSHAERTLRALKIGYCTTSDGQIQNRISLSNLISSSK